MPKMKTRRAVAKRFSATGNGKLKRKRAGLRHILEKQSPKTKRNAVKTDYVHQSDVGRMKRCMPGV